MCVFNEYVGYEEQKCNKGTSSNAGLDDVFYHQVLPCTSWNKICWGRGGWTDDTTVTDERTPEEIKRSVFVVVPLIDVSTSFGTTKSLRIFFPFRTFTTLSPFNKKFFDRWFLSKLPFMVQREPETPQVVYNRDVRLDVIVTSTS